MADWEYDTACPECVAGKHGNCDGAAWDNERDEPTICECWANGHD